jgi:hypothetical protein
MVDPRFIDSHAGDLKAFSKFGNEFVGDLLSAFAERRRGPVTVSER